ncbi:MAG: hypothetical protein ACPG4S_04815 [Schleiferiaceae bacterium]|nr:MAG: Uncharacterised protein [Cryomorphaceae bacterium]
MKNVLTLLFALTLGVASTSCTPEAVSVVDTEAQIFMNNKSFEVSSYEFYDFTTQENYEKTADFDSMFFTVKDDTAFLTKVLIAPGQEGQTSNSWETYEVVFEGGVLQGIWLNKYTYMEVSSFDRIGEKVVIEFGGAHELHKQYQSIFLVLTALDYHPAGAAQISGLPG